MILRPCSLPESLSRFQAVNNPSMPVAKMKGYQREELWVKVTSAIVDAMSSQKSTVNSFLKQSDLKAEDHEDYVALHKDEPIDIERGQKETTLENDLADQQGLIKQSVKVWNQWRIRYADIQPDLSDADLTFADLEGANLESAVLRGANLEGANLKYAVLRGANLEGIILSGADLSLSDLSDADLRSADLRSTNLYTAVLHSANLEGANLSGANLSRANLNGTNFRGANLSRIDFSEKDLTGANFSRADLTGANFSRANLTGVDLQGANLKTAIFVETNLENASLTNCLVYGVSAWDVQLRGAIQQNLVITLPNKPTITIDNLKLAQFIYLLLHGEEVRDAIDTITSKVVLILGRFTPERKGILDTIREELRKYNYLPTLFDFDVPRNRDLTETISTLAHLSRFIIVDLTDSSGLPYEIATIASNLVIPVQPLLLQDDTRHTPVPVMFPDLMKRYHWILPICYYKDPESLLAVLREHVIEPAEHKLQGLARPHPQ